MNIVTREWSRRRLESARVKLLVDIETREEIGRETARAVELLCRVEPIV
jgi:hypothetical protein